MTCVMILRYVKRPPEALTLRVCENYHILSISRETCENINLCSGISRCHTVPFIDASYNVLPFQVCNYENESSICGTSSEPLTQCITAVQ